MNTDIPRDISAEEIETYHRDGVVLLPAMFDADWIDLLSRGLLANCNAPTNRSRVWDRDAEGRTMFYDSQAWQGVDEYRQFIFESPAAQIAAQLMGSAQINFYFDAVFVRSPGSQFSTPWHQDEPYWSVDGYDTCTIWMPLVPVKRENALAYVPGSHRLDSVFYPSTRTAKAMSTRSTSPTSAKWKFPTSIPTRKSLVSSAGICSRATVSPSTAASYMAVRASSTRTASYAFLPASGSVTTCTSSSANAAWTRTTAP
jgi:hypothetical protein